jgi:transcription antitermination factor NusG
MAKANGARRYIDADGRRWVVVETRVAGYATGDIMRRVERFLAEQGFAAFLPWVWARARPGQPAQVFRPLFPRYLFAGALPDQAMTPIRSTRGVRGILANGEGHALLVPVACLAALRARVHAGNGAVLPPRETPGQRFRKGAKLRIVSGQLSGWSALFECDEGDRIKIFVDIFGRRTLVTLPSGHVAES